MLDLVVKMADLFPIQQIYSEINILSSEYQWLSGI